jgi:ABC-type multidrug transport system fused ATPase/permease subunit
MRKMNLWRLIVVVAIVVAIMAFKFGFVIWPFVFFALLIIAGAIIIDGISEFANKSVDALAKRQAVSNEEINAKIELTMQRMQVIENKVDKINTILEKVSE